MKLGKSKEAKIKRSKPVKNCRPAVLIRLKIWTKRKKLPKKFCAEILGKKIEDCSFIMYLIIKLFDLYSKVSITKIVQKWQTQHFNEQKNSERSLGWD